MVYTCIQIPHLPLLIKGTAWGLFCFCAGYLMKNHETNKVIIIVSLFIYLLSLLTNIPEVYSNKHAATEMSKLLWLPLCVFSSINFNNICRVLENVGMRIFKNGKEAFPLIRYIGRHSMTYYVVHYMIFRVVYDIIGTYCQDWYASWQGLAICIVAYFAIITPFIMIKDRVCKR